MHVHAYAALAEKTALVPFTDPNPELVADYVEMTVHDSDLSTVGKINDAIEKIKLGELLYRALINMQELHHAQH